MKPVQFPDDKKPDPIPPPPGPNSPQLINTSAPSGGN
jgi:hypothetical protein